MALICVDACVFLNILHPNVSKATKQDITASQQIIDMIQKGQIHGIAPSMMMSEVIWVSGRLYKHQPESIFMDQLDELMSAFPTFFGENFQLIPVDSFLASEAALLRLKYYSRKTPISYNDALYLSVSIIREVDCLVTNDKQLLNLEEDVNILTPSQFINEQ